MSETVNHPKHYNAHPSGIECIAVVEHMNFCLGNAIKYIWLPAGGEREAPTTQGGRPWLTCSTPSPFASP